MQGINNKRQFLSLAAVAGVAYVAPRFALAVDAENEMSQEMLITLKGIVGKKVQRIHYSDVLSISAPDMPELTQLVPVTVAGDLSAVTSMIIMCDTTPDTVIARFNFSEQKMSRVGTRIKMTGSPRVFAIAESAQGLEVSSRYIGLIGCRYQG